MAILIFAGFQTPVAHAQTCMISPTKLGVVSGRFGKARGGNAHGSAVSRAHMHGGLDFSTQGTNQPVYAASDGTVVAARFSSTGGNLIHIKRPNGDVITYMHLASFAPGIKPGESITAGQNLGLSGNTPAPAMAKHLHFEYVIPNKDNARAAMFPSNVSGSAFNPQQLPNQISAVSGLGFRTDPSPYFCDTFPIKDGHPAHAAKLGADTKAQYEIFFGSVPDGGVAPNTGYSDEAVAGANHDALTSGEDEFYYGTIPEAVVGNYDTDSVREIMLTEAYRRMGDMTWHKNLTYMSERGLWVDYDRLQGTKAFLEHAIEEKRRRIEMLYAAYTSLKIENSSLTEETISAGFQAASSQIK